jgi:membrane associated rhomboid family serine protease
MKVTTPETTLIIHAIAAPVIFTCLSLVYFRRPIAWSPLRTAAVFLGVVVVMDVFVVALLVERSFEMFASILGTWLPFLLIFLSTWFTGIAVRARRPRSQPATEPLAPRGIFAARSVGGSRAVDRKNRQQ